MRSKALFGLFPEAASTLAKDVDLIMILLLVLCGLVLLLVFGLIAYFAIKYRQGSPHSRQIRSDGQLKLEWGWTIATFFVFLGIYVWSALVFVKMHVAPPDATEISVVGKQWMWKFQHPTGQREINELHVPVGTPILLTMTSEDVIHSFFVPEFRMKQDVLPGRYTYTWFQATHTGEFFLFCTQYCGTMHADMRGKIIVMTRADYQAWLQNGISGAVKRGALDMATQGRKLFTTLGCVSCHDIQAGIKAPSLYGIYGTWVGLSDGTRVRADENYLRESILNPSAKIVQGYEDIMPTFQGLLTEDGVLDLIAYIKSLQATPPGGVPNGPSHSSAIPTREK